MERLKRAKSVEVGKATQAAAGPFIRRNLGRAMRQLRQDAGITQEQLAEALRLGQGNVSRYERGLQWVESAERLCAVANALQVPPWVMLLTADGMAAAHSPDTMRDAATLVQLFLGLSQADQRRLLEHARGLRGRRR